MSLIPGENSNSEGPPNQTGHIWFLRACVGLSLTLWSWAMAQPLGTFTGHPDGYSDWGTIQTNQVYPLVPSDKAPVLASWLVGGSFLAILLAGVMVGTLASENTAARSWADAGVAPLGLWIAFVALFSWHELTPDNSKLAAGQTPSHFTPLAGTWLIWAALALLAIPAFQTYEIKKPKPAPAGSGPRRVTS